VPWCHSQLCRGRGWLSDHGKSARPRGGAAGGQKGQEQEKARQRRERGAYRCIMAWRSRSAAPEAWVEVADEAMVGDGREVGSRSTVGVERVGTRLDDLMRR